MNPRQTSSHSIHSQPPILRTGIPSLDQILKGGIPSGCLCLIEESSTNNFSEILSKSYLGEGAVSNDFLFTYSETLENTYIPNIRRIGNSSLQDESIIRYETFAVNSKVREPYAIDLKSTNSEYKN